MNTFAVIILVALLLEFALGTMADLLNLASAPETVPGIFAAVI